MLMLPTRTPARGSRREGSLPALSKGVPPYQLFRQPPIGLPFDLPHPARGGTNHATTLTPEGSTLIDSLHPLRQNPAGSAIHTRLALGGSGPGCRHLERWGKARTRSCDTRPYSNLLEA